MNPDRTEADRPDIDAPEPTRAGAAARTRAASQLHTDRATLGGILGLPAASHLNRRKGRRAERAAAEVRVARAETLRDWTTAHRVHAELARRLAMTGVDLREAIAHARRALELKHDEELLEQLVDWLEGTGQWSRAVKLLSEHDVKGCSPQTLKWCHRLAKLAWRSGDAAAAMAVLSDMAPLDSEGTDSLEQLACVAQWSANATDLERGVNAWLEASKRLRARGGRLPAFEAVLRAFELSPGSSVAAEALTRELEELGRIEAVDEVLRIAAREGNVPEKHLHRAARALAVGDAVWAFAACLDARVDLTLDPENLLAAAGRVLSPGAAPTVDFDSLLADLGLKEWLAARLELALILSPSAPIASGWMALARLQVAALGHPESAHEALVKTIIVDPGHQEARDAIAAASSPSKSSAAVLRALVHAARTHRVRKPSLPFVKELLTICQRGEGSAELGLWAARHARELSVDGLVTEEQEASWRQQSEREALEIERTLLAMRDGVAPTGEELELLERRLALSPDRIADHLSVVLELVECQPHKSLWQTSAAEIVDVLALAGVGPENDARVPALLDRARRLLGARGELVAARWHLRREDAGAALAVLRGTLHYPAPSACALAWTLTLARRVGDGEVAARCLVRLAAVVPPDLRGALEVLAAETYMEIGDRDQALLVARGAHRNASTMARLGSLEVELSELLGPRAVTDSVERILGLAPPSARLALSLARAHAALGEVDLAVAWVQRACALRPGDPEIREMFINMALDLAEPARVAEILEQLPELPLPVATWRAPAASALAWLASADPNRAAKVTRRILPMVGASDASLRAAQLDAARMVGDGELSIDILERAAAVATNSEEFDRVIGERRWLRQDIDGALFVAVRALRSGATVENWMREMLSVTGELSGDAELNRLELAVTAARVDGNLQALVNGLREIGAARFDLAQDVDGAVRAWREAVQIDLERLLPTFAVDLRELFGSEAAVARLEQLAQELTGLPERARVLGFAAQIALDAGDALKASDLIEQALTLDPTQPEFLQLAEHAVTVTADLERLERLYALALGAVMGAYGERALNYRAALTFERLKDIRRALNHGLAAFDAVPTQGITLGLVGRMAKAANDSRALVDVVTGAADKAKSRMEATRWLQCGLLQFGQDDDGLRAKLDIALKILVGAPGPDAIHQVDSIVAEMQIRRLDDVEYSMSRFERALRALLGKLEGPDGARCAIAVIFVALQRLGTPQLASDALPTALSADAGVEQFADLMALVPHWSKSSDSVDRAIDRSLQLLQEPYSNLALPALKLLGALVVSRRRYADLTVVLKLARGIDAVGWLLDLLEDCSIDLCSWPGTNQLLFQVIDQSFDSSVPQARVAQFVERTIGTVASRLDSDASGSSTEPHGRAADVAVLLEAYGTSLAKLKGIVAAREAIEGFGDRVSVDALAAAAVEIERQGQDRMALARALAHRALGADPPGPEASIWLTEAANLAEEAGDIDLAIDYWLAANDLSPGSASASIGLAEAQYRKRGAGSKAEAAATMEVLKNVDGELTEEELERLSFLRAEALKVEDEPAASVEQLVTAHAAVGDRPLVALGLAERLVASGDRKVALPLLAAALSGDLRGLRSRAAVALFSARVARDVGNATLAAAWLEPALSDPTTRPEALTLRAELDGEVNARPLETAARSDGDGNASGEANHQNVPAEGQPGVEVVQSGKSSDIVVSEAQSPQIGDDAQMGKAVESEPIVAADRDLPPGALLPAEAPSTEQELPSRAWANSAEIEVPRSLDEAVERAREVAEDPAKRAAWAHDGRQWLRLWPYSIQLCTLVKETADTDGNESHARALEHVLEVLGWTLKPSCPPDLADQQVDVDAVRGLLLRDTQAAGGEALALAWEGAERLFRKDPSDYGVTGLERVVVGSTTTVARLVLEASRRLGLSRLPVFHRRGHPPLQMKVLMLNPPGLLIEGDVAPDDQVAAFDIGAMLWAGLPEHVLAVGLPPSGVEEVLEALRLAFGPPGRQPTADLGGALHIAEVLWQVISGRSQRRLREICTEPLEPSRTLSSVRQSLRRAGLFVSGDLNVALRRLAEDEGLSAALVDQVPWERLCAEHPEIADLLRIATSADYAHLRWSAPGSGHFMR